MVKNFSLKRARLAVPLALVAAASALAGITAAAPVANAVAPIPASALGASAATAAGSCWEIKQVRPTAPSGSYWLLTPKMSAPSQFYCDQTTDGGGWVLIGKGRDMWSERYDGTGASAQANLQSPNTSPMSNVSRQLPSTTVDQLLNGARPDSLPLADGVRVRRATKADGSAWQEVRIKFSRHARWTWTFGSEYAVSNFSFTVPCSGWFCPASGVSTTTGTGGIVGNFGADDGTNRVYGLANKDNGWRHGFGYGTFTTGTNSSTSYLFSATNNGGHAQPYAQVYLRPKVTSTAGFASIPDAGTAAIANPKSLSTFALENKWGVSGLAGDVSYEDTNEVQAFAQVGNTMYVGGNFKFVQKDAAGTGQVQQSYLAGFDVNTGEWISTFRPTFNEQVKALTALPNGKLLVGGSFTVANGKAAGALVALDPVTGATDTSYKIAALDTSSSPRLRVNVLQAAPDGYVYVGGTFTHIKGGPANAQQFSRNLARFSAADGTPVNNWNLDFNGTVVDLDVAQDGSHVYAAGNFSQESGGPAPQAASIRTSPGALLESWSPTWSNKEKYYQQAIESAGNGVWVGGAEHSVFRFSASSYARTNGSIQRTGGDAQAMATDNGLLFAGCHCYNYGYSDAYAWTKSDQLLASGWTEADSIDGFGVWDATTGQRVPGFTPTMRYRAGSGIWALEVDSNGTVWAGGDITNAATAAKPGAWSGAFARFPRLDSTPSAAPTSLQVLGQDSAGVTLSWTKPEAGTTFQILRDDRTIASTSATTITLPYGGNNKFFVRAVDKAGNISASTAALTVAPPPAGTSELFAKGATWEWYYQTAAPAADWLTNGFGASGASGAAPLGYGTTITLGTNIDTFAADPTLRPVAAYFRKTFSVADAARVTGLQLRGIADDGFVVYVNGVEVARSNMPSGTVTNTTNASTAVNSTTAANAPVVIDVSPQLLVSGNNVIAVETHLNYRKTPDISFDMSATITAP